MKLFLRFGNLIYNKKTKYSWLNWSDDANAQKVVRINFSCHIIFTCKVPSFPYLIVIFHFCLKSGFILWHPKWTVLSVHGNPSLFQITKINSKYCYFFPQTKFCTKLFLTFFLKIICPKDAEKIANHLIFWLLFCNKSGHVFHFFKVISMFWLKIEDENEMETNNNKNFDNLSKWENRQKKNWNQLH